MSDLEAILNGEVEAEAPANPVITEEVAETLNAEPAGEEVPTPPVEEVVEDQGQVEEVAEVESPEIAAFKTKAIDETRKRQELANENQQLREQLAKQATQEERPGFWDDPEAAIGEIGQSVDQKIARARTDMSEDLMRSITPDYDDKITVFADLVQGNPSIAAQMNQSSNPAKFAYNYAKSHLEMQEIGNIDNYKAKIRAELKAEMETEKATAIEEALKTRSSLPGSLSSERAVGGNEKAAYTPPTLESVIG